MPWTCDVGGWAASWAHSCWTGQALQSSRAWASSEGSCRPCSSPKNIPVRPLHAARWCHAGRALAIDSRRALTGPSLAGGRSRWWVTMWAAGRRAMSVVVAAWSSRVAGSRDLVPMGTSVPGANRRAGHPVGQVFDGHRLVLVGAGRPVSSVGRGVLSGRVARLVPEGRDVEPGPGRQGAGEGGPEVAAHRKAS